MLEIADYAMLSITALSAVLGLFIGFSGAIAFFAGLLSAVAFGYFAYDPFGAFIVSIWLRTLAIAIASLIVFGLVRLIVKKCVHGLVAQPGDAIFGAISAAMTGAAVSLGAVGLLFLGLGMEASRSFFLKKLLVLIGW